MAIGVGFSPVAQPSGVQWFEPPLKLLEQSLLNKQKHYDDNALMLGKLKSVYSTLDGIEGTYDRKRAAEILQGYEQKAKDIASKYNGDLSLIDSDLKEFQMQLEKDFGKQGEANYIIQATEGLKEAYKLKADLESKGNPLTDWQLYHLIEKPLEQYREFGFKRSADADPLKYKPYQAGSVIADFDENKFIDEYVRGWKANTEFDVDKAGNPANMFSYDKATGQYRRNYAINNDGTVQVYQTEGREYVSEEEVSEAAKALLLSNENYVRKANAVFEYKLNTGQLDRRYTRNGEELTGDLAAEGLIYERTRKGLETDPDTFLAEMYVGWSELPESAKQGIKNQVTDELKQKEQELRTKVVSLEQLATNGELDGDAIKRFNNYLYLQDEAERVVQPYAERESYVKALYDEKLMKSPSFEAKVAKDVARITNAGREEFYRAMVEKIERDAINQDTDVEVGTNITVGVQEDYDKLQKSLKESEDNMYNSVHSAFSKMAGLVGTNAGNVMSQMQKHIEFISKQQKIKPNEYRLKILKALKSTKGDEKLMIEKLKQIGFTENDIKALTSSDGWVQPILEWADMGLAANEEYLKKKSYEENLKEKAVVSKLSNDKDYQENKKKIEKYKTTLESLLSNKPNKLTELEYIERILSIDDNTNEFQLINILKAQGVLTTKDKKKFTASDLLAFNTFNKIFSNKSNLREVKQALIAKRENIKAETKATKLYTQENLTDDVSSFPLEDALSDKIVDAFNKNNLNNNVKFYKDGNVSTTTVAEDIKRKYGVNSETKTTGVAEPADAINGKQYYVMTYQVKVKDEDGKVLRNEQVSYLVPLEDVNIKVNGKDYRPPGASDAARSRSQIEGEVRTISSTYDFHYTSGKDSKGKSYEKKQTIKYDSDTGLYTVATTVEMNGEVKMIDKPMRLNEEQANILANELDAQNALKQNLNLVKPIATGTIPQTHIYTKFGEEAIYTKINPMDIIPQIITGLTDETISQLVNQYVVIDKKELEAANKKAEKSGKSVNINSLIGIVPEYNSSQHIVIQRLSPVLIETANDVKIKMGFKKVGSNSYSVTTKGGKVVNTKTSTTRYNYGN